MRLLICTQALDRRDPILGFFHRWVEEFAAHCEEVLVVCLFAGEYRFPENVRVYSLGKEQEVRSARDAAPSSRAFARLRYARRTVALAWRLRREYDAVFVHMNPEYLLAAGWLWRLWGKRVSLWYTHKHVSWRLRAGVWFADVVFTASKESFRLSSRKLQVMGHGIDLARPVPPHVPAPGQVRLITTGRISPVKGLEVMLDAFFELKTKGLDASFIVYGAPASSTDEEYQARLKARLSTGGVDPQSVFAGPIAHDELPARRARADYLLHASKTGSLDKNVLDACVSRVIPVSSSEAYGELFAGYERLLVYPKGDGVALARRIEALEALPEEERIKIRAALFDRVARQHSLQSLVPRMLTLI